MKPEDIKQLLGGYATGTLTPEEQKALFDAALQDQELFDELAAEQVLKEAIEDPSVRRDLIADLEPKPSWRTRWTAWMRPAYPLAAAGALALATFAVVYIVRDRGPARQATTEIAQSWKPAVRQPAQVALPEPGATPIRDQVPATPPARSVPTDARSPQRALVPSSDGAPPAAPPPSVRELVAAAESAKRAAAAPGPAADAASQPAALPVQTEPQANSFRTPVVAQDRAQAITSRAGQARDLFYASPPPGASGVVGGVVGGVSGGLVRSQSPMSAQRKAESKSATSEIIRLQPLGVRYSVTSGGGAVQVVLEANTDSTAYLFRRVPSGDWLPVAPGGMSMKAHTATTVPAFTPDAAVAEPRAILVLARRPLPQLAQSGASLAAAIDALRSQAESTRPVTQVEDPSTFVVLPVPRPADAIVVVLSIP